MTCECSQPGWCPRHQCRKTPHWYKLCQSRPEYFQLWEDQKGPGQSGKVHEIETLLQNRDATWKDVQENALSCHHRGEILRQETCQLCSNRGLAIDVFQCSIHGQCTLRRWGTNPEAIKMAKCLTCSDRQPNGS